MKIATDPLTGLKTSSTLFHLPYDVIRREHLHISVSGVELVYLANQRIHNSSFKLDY